MPLKSTKLLHAASKFLPEKQTVIYYTGTPPRLNSPCSGEEAYPPRRLTQVHQRGELVAS